MFSYRDHADEQLLRDIRNGEEPAFDELYSRYWEPLYLYARRRLDDDQQAEDIVQDVFVRLWIRKEELEINDIAAYLHSAVRYTILSYLSRHRKGLTFFAPFETMLTDIDDPEQCMIAKQSLELMYAYIDTLSERKKQIFLMHITGRLSTKEIASMLGITQKAVQNQLGTALHGLKRSLIPFVITLIMLKF
jgi:RNA polymerase sigma-70 factor (ECF subfamily)